MYVYVCNQEKLDQKSPTAEYTTVQALDNCEHIYNKLVDKADKSSPKWQPRLALTPLALRVTLVANSTNLLNMFIVV